MTVINLRGTNGSGKTTLVKKIISLYGKSTNKIMVPRRKNPVAYQFAHPGSGQVLMVLGSYEGDSGGCDTLPTKKFIYDMVHSANNLGMHVLYEGIMISNDTIYTIENHNRGCSAICMVLDTAIEDCTAAVHGRRIAKNPDAPPLDPYNLVNKHRASFSSLEKLKAAGVSTEIWSREGALVRIRELLEV